MLLNKKSNFERRGVTVVETAIVISVALMMIFAVFEYGRYLMISDLVNNAVREGARQAVVTTNTQNTANIQNTVIYYLGGQSLVNSQGVGLQASDVQVFQANANGTPIANMNWYDAPFGTTIGVQVTVTYQPILPTLGFLPKTFQLQSTAMMTSEAN
jgi:Flp pilus assembly protein TadG